MARPVVPPSRVPPVSAPASRRSSKHRGTLRVPDGVVEVVPGVYLPADDYPAEITTNHISIRGNTVDQVGLAHIMVTEQFLVGIGVPPSTGSSTSGGVEVSKYIASGQVTEV